MKLNQNHYIAAIIVVAALIGGYFWLFNPMTKTYPYYEIRQSYAPKIERDQNEYFTITTNVVRVFKKRDKFDYKPEEYEKTLYNRSIGNILFDSIDVCLIKEYDNAQSHINSYEHIDLMINKDYKK